MDVADTPVYRRTLARWQAGKITIKEVELLVKTGWLTREQADDIYTHPRALTPLVEADPFSPERVYTIQEELTNGAR